MIRTVTDEFSGKIHRKLGWWHHKNDHNSKNKNLRFFRFYFSNYGHFCDVSTPISNEFFTITRKIKIRKMFIIFFHYIQHITHPSWNWDQNWGGGVCLSLVGRESSLRIFHLIQHCGHLSWRLDHFWGGGEVGLSLSWEKSSQFVNLDFKFTYCVVAPLQSPMAPQNSIFYLWPPFNVPWPPGGPLGTRLGTPELHLQ